MRKLSALKMSGRNEVSAWNLGCAHSELCTVPVRRGGCGLVQPDLGCSLDLDLDLDLDQG